MQQECMRWVRCEKWSEKRFHENTLSDSNRTFWIFKTFYFSIRNYLHLTGDWKRWKGLSVRPKKIRTAFCRPHFCPPCIIIIHPFFMLHFRMCTLFRRSCILKPLDDVKMLVQHTILTECEFLIISTKSHKYPKQNTIPPTKTYNIKAFSYSETVIS